MPDVKERTALARVMCVWYDRTSSERSALLEAIGQQLCLLTDVPLAPHCATPFLLVLKHAWSSKATSSRRGLLAVIRDSVLPLLGFPYLPFYYSLIRDLLVSVVVDYPELGVGALASVQRYWPLTRPAKASMIVLITMRLATVCDRHAFAAHAPHFFRALGRWLVGSNYAIIVQILSVIAQPTHEMVSFLGDFAGLVAAEITPALVVIARDHPVEDTRESAAAAFANVAMIVTGALAPPPLPRTAPPGAHWCRVFKAAGADPNTIPDCIFAHGSDDTGRFLAPVHTVVFGSQLRPSASGTGFGCE
jgi:hypothetical protein